MPLSLHRLCVLASVPFHWHHYLCVHPLPLSPCVNLLCVPLFPALCSWPFVPGISVSCLPCVFMIQRHSRSLQAKRVNCPHTALRTLCATDPALWAPALQTLHCGHPSLQIPCTSNTLQCSRTAAHTLRHTHTHVASCSRHILPQTHSAE